MSEGSPFRIRKSQQALGAAYGVARTVVARRVSIAECLFRPSTAISTVASGDVEAMSPYQGVRIFSHVVLGLMLAGIVYAAYIAVTYWTGISV